MAKGSRLVIREVWEEDIDDIRVIEHSIGGRHRSATYQDPMTAYVGGELSVSLVAELDGKVVGFLLGRTWQGGTGEPGDAWLDLIGVSLEHQKRGVGSRLVEVFLDGCKKQGVKAARVIVTKGDEPLQRFLEKRGFATGELVNLRKRLDY